MINSIMTASPLNRPIWHALSTRLRTFAIGDGRALRLAPDFGPFAAAPDDSPESLKALTALVASHGPLVLMQVDPIVAPPETSIRMNLPIVQMVATSVQPMVPSQPVVQLAPADAPQMLDLAKRTEPGPFFKRTPELGPFWGVKDGDTLVSMAGERLTFPGFTEVSGVCTDASQRGKGLAGLLSRTVASQIMKRGDTPFLHALATNTTAISLYKTLGFEIRSTANAILLAKA